MDNNLPNEIFSMILGHLDFKNVRKFLNLRLVSQHWKNMVEDFCLRTIRSLHFNHSEDHVRNPYRMMQINHYFFGAVKIKSFLPVHMKDFTTLDRNVKHLIVRLFPNIERLVIECHIYDQSTFENLIFLMSHWKNISILSLESFIDPCYHSEIASTINGLEKLTHLDIGLKFIPLHYQTLSRIRHLSIEVLPEQPMSQILCLIDQIGKNCNSLWIKMMSVPLNLKIILPWIETNPSLFNRLTHFGCFEVDDDAYKFICAHFPSLQTVYIYVVLKSSSMFPKMNCESRLNELRLLGVFCFSVPDLCKEISETKPMTNIHIFELCLYASKEIGLLCTHLAWFLPNIKHLILVVPSSMDEVEIIKKNLSLFKNLCTYKVKQIA